MHTIDLRSDTITLPTPAMMQAIATAELGDDVFGDDPTVNRLEAVAAERVGKEAALLVMSGTMANLVAVLTHCMRGDEIIVGDKAHIFLNEAGGCSAVGGIHSHQVPNQPDGTLDLSDVEDAIRSDNVHYPRSRLICLENTHNRCGGACLTADTMRQVRQLADRYDLKVHLDGARVFNAAVALGVDVKELTCDADSVAFCLSKGLSAPVGSLVCGSAEFIHMARRTRKIVGGGARQAGIIAAAGIVALEQMVDRLADDHANARLLAQGLVQIPDILINPAGVQTNIVYFDLPDPLAETPLRKPPCGNPLAETGDYRRGLPQGTTAGDYRRLGTAADFCQRLAANGVRMLPTGRRTVRAVTHHGIEREDVEAALPIIAKVAAG